MKKWSFPALMAVMRGSLGKRQVLLVWLLFNLAGLVKLLTMLCCKDIHCKYKVQRSCQSTVHYGIIVFRIH